MEDKNHPEPENDLEGCRSKISERKQSIVINLLAILDKSTRSPSNSSSSSNEDNVSFPDVGEDISQNLFLYTPYCYFFPEGKSRASSADCESTESSSSDDEEVFVKKCQKQKCQQNNPSEKLQKSRPRWSSINKRLRKRRPKASKREKKILEGLKNENTTSTHRQSRSPKRKTKIVKNTTRRFFSLPSLNEESNRIENLDHDRRKLKKNIFLKSHKPSLAI